MLRSSGSSQPLCVRFPVYVRGAGGFVWLVRPITLHNAAVSNVLLRAHVGTMPSCIRYCAAIGRMTWPPAPRRPSVLTSTPSLTDLSRWRCHSMPGSNFYRTTLLPRRLCAIPCRTR